MTIYADVIEIAVGNVRRNGMEHTLEVLLPHYVIRTPSLGSDTFSVGCWSPSFNGVSVTVHEGIVDTVRSVWDQASRAMRYDSHAELALYVGDIRVWADDDDHSKGFIGTDGYPENMFDVSADDRGNVRIDVKP